SRDNQLYPEFRILVASNASVYTNAKNHPFPFYRTNGFLLVEALPQAPMNAALRTAAARFWESLFFESSVRQRGLALYLFTLTDIG
ncbi:MAG: hypothetical protein MSS60_05240, partial [Clostridiales bacterium]|nr:hypothetical protein [Clostridiales bacterium]